VAGSDVVRATRGAVSSAAVAGESVFTDAEVGESAMAMVDVSSSGRRMEHTGSSSHWVHDLICNTQQTRWLLSICLLFY